MANTILKRVNINGVPTIRVETITTSGTVTTLNFNEHPFLANNYSGALWVKIPQNTTTLTTTNSVEFNTIGVVGSNIPLKLANGDATVADIATPGGGIFECFYDRESNYLQLT